MPYGMRLEPEAEEDLKRLPQTCRQQVLHHLGILCESPTVLSKPSHIPFRPGFQIYPFDFDHQGFRWFFNVLFKYGGSEEMLYIAAISANPVDLTNVDDWDFD